MSRYEFTFVLYPAGYFGCPEEGKLVYPAGGGDIFSAEIDFRTGNSIGHPTLSIYREVPFNKTISISEATIKFVDNYVLLFIENKDDQSAVNNALSIINRFCQNLSVRNGHYFYYGIVQAISGERKVLVPRNLNLLSARLYNLTTISEHIDEIVNITSIDVDPILEKAKAYFCHALYMNDEIAEKIEPFSFHSLLIISDVMLNYNKATTTIVGDSSDSEDKDYKYRYKKFGITDTLWEDVQVLRRLRNKYDIAHYSKDWDAIDFVKNHQAFAKNTAQSVILKYMEYLKSLKE